MNTQEYTKRFGTEETCPKNPTGHQPDWASVYTDNDGDDTVYIDVLCKYCRRSGCVGSAEKLAEGLSW